MGSCILKKYGKLWSALSQAMQGYCVNVVPSSSLPDKFQKGQGGLPQQVILVGDIVFWSLYSLYLSH